MTDVTLNTVALSTAVPTAEVLQVARQLTGARRNVFVDVPGRAGSWVFAEQPGDRTLVLRLHIGASSFAERREAVRELAYWAEVGTPARLIVDDEPDRYHDAILDASVDVNEWLTEAAAIEVPFRVGPYAYALDITTETIAATSPSPAVGSFTAPDTVEALPIVEITPTNGTITSLIFTLNGAALTYGTDIADDATVSISSLVDTVFAGTIDPSLVGLLNPAAVSMAEVSGEFGRIVEGVNDWSLSWTGTATAITVGIRWRERFR